MLTRLALTMFYMFMFVSNIGFAGKKDSLVEFEDFRVGDTLRYTTDGSFPDRSSRYFIVGENKVHVTKTTTFRARLYRPGFLPSEVKTLTVYVRDSLTTSQVRWRSDGNSQK
jgi:hypothetical protein